MRERDRQVQDDERAPRADELLERALARWLAALERVGADARGAFSADDLIHRAERAKRNRETVLGHAPALPRSER